MKLLHSMYHNLFFWYAISLHLIWGVSLLNDPSVTHVTALSELHWISTDAGQLGIILIVFAGLAFLSIIQEGHWSLISCLFLRIPQQFVLVLSCISALEAIYFGHFADGVQRPVAFLIADQSPAILVVVGYTITVVRQFFNPAHK